MKRKCYQVKRTSRSSYRRYRMHKVKKQWIVKSSVIGAIILSGPTSVSAIEAADTTSVEQSADPTEDATAIDPYESEVSDEEILSGEPENNEQTEVPFANSSVSDETDQLEGTGVIPDEQISEEISLRMTPLEEKVDVEIVQPAINMAQTVQNEPEIAALIANLLQAQKKRYSELLWRCNCCS